MERINAISTSTIAFVTVICGAIAVVTFISQFTTASGIVLIHSIIIYIVVILLFLVWLRRKLK